MTARITPTTAQHRLDDGHDLTPGELAALVGLHRQTVIRYLDHGLEDPPRSGRRWRPPHGRTPGGHRSIPHATAERFVDLVRAHRAGTHVARDRRPTTGSATRRAPFGLDFRPPPD